MRDCVYTVWCSIVMLFTCTLVWSRPVGKEGFERETWAVGVNSKILGGPKQIRRMFLEESSKGLSQTLDWGYEGHIHEVLQKDGRYSMYKLWLHNYAVKRNYCKLFIACYLWLIRLFLARKLNLQYWSMFIFRRLKINHDSHEFILEFCTVSNTNND